MSLKAYDFGPSDYGEYGVRRVEPESSRDECLELHDRMGPLLDLMCLPRQCNAWFASPLMPGLAPGAWLDVRFDPSVPGDRYGRPRLQYHATIQPCPGPDPAPDSGPPAPRLMDLTGRARRGLAKGNSVALRVRPEHEVEFVRLAREVCAGPHEIAVAWGLSSLDAEGAAALQRLGVRLMGFVRTPRNLPAPWRDLSSLYTQVD